MNMPHKVPDEWLLSYAAGAIDPGRSLLVASQVSYHDDLQAAVADAEAIGGALLESMQETRVQDSALEKLLDRLDDKQVNKPAPVTRSSAAGDLPEPLLEFLDCDVEALDWRFIVPGMKHTTLWTGPQGQRLWMLRARAGMAMAEHGHTGDEWALILRGSYTTEFGTYGVGSMDMADHETVHKPTIDKGDECMCLVYSDGPIKMKGIAGKLLQPFVGI